MYNNINQLEAFYLSPLGEHCYELIDCQLKSLIPNTKKLNILGIGFTSPWLEKYISESENLFLFIPYDENIYYWPKHKKNLSCGIDQNNIPVQDLFFDIVIIFHTLEYSSNTHIFLQEVWRVLKGEGKVLILIPNRLGFWARNKNNPFGHGHPFSKSQIVNLLKINRFEDIKVKFSLYFPPINKRFLLNYFKRIEQFFLKWSFGFGGVILVEAKKQIYATRSLKNIKNKNLNKLISLPVKAMRVSNLIKGKWKIWTS